MRYKTILADPPWPMSIIPRRVRPNQKNMPYSTMSVAGIASLRVDGVAVSDLAENEAHLYLWTTHKYLPTAFDIMESWGFKYHCMITWDKTYGMTPLNFMFSTEFCLFGQRPGKFLKLKKLGEKTLIREKPMEHSRKPLSMYELIEKVSYPPYLELFGRPHSPLFSKRDEWDVWGDEI